MNEHLLKLNDYFDTNKALILYDQIDSNYYDNKVLSKIVATWIEKYAKNTNYPIVYRFCGQTIFSNNLYNLIQSIMHQLCFLFEIHESFAFHVSLDIKSGSSV